MRNTNLLPIGNKWFHPLQLGHHSLGWLHKDSTEYSSQPQAVQILSSFWMHIFFPKGKVRNMLLLIHITKHQMTEKRIKDRYPCIRMIIKGFEFAFSSGSFLLTLRFILRRSSSYTYVTKEAYTDKIITTIIELSNQMH